MAMSFPLVGMGRALTLYQEKASSDDTDGYIFCVVVFDDDGHTDSIEDELIFAADDIVLGPIAQLRHLDISLYFTLHSCWMKHVQSRSTAYSI